MTEKNTGFIGKIMDILDEKLEKKSREKTSCDCENTEDQTCSK